ncbi:hypothetical protein H8959_017019 [Pygathrix nigripes]
MPLASAWGSQEWKNCPTTTVGTPGTRTPTRGQWGPCSCLRHLPGLPRGPRLLAASLCSQGQDWQMLPPSVVLDLPQETLEEETPGANLWPTTITFLTLFLLSLFYSTALTVTSVRGPSGNREGPQY